MENIYKDILFGVAIGDALGVPVEFKSRETIAKSPVVDMIGFGTYNLPAGTFSDDSSLTFCLAESLTKQLTLESIAENMIKWYYEKFWTPYGEVFDIGIATRQSITKLKNGEKPNLAGGNDVSSNGNGSLMRILPLLTITRDLPIEERYFYIKEVSSITHRHIRSIIACFYYLEFARQITLGINKYEIYKNLQIDPLNLLNRIGTKERELDIYERLFNAEIYKLTETEIQSSGYVVHTLEASIWCIMTTNNYADAVLKAVNLGEDTDTTAAVTGGLAGLLYGYENIPKKWLNQLAKGYEINELAERWEEFASSQH